MKQFKKTWKTLTLLAIFTGLLTTPHIGQAASAPFMGTYIDLSSGTGEYEWDTSSVSFDMDTSSAAIGFVLETDPLGKGPFSYRLNVGLEGQTLEDNYDVVIDLGGIVLENIFAFTIAKEPNLRWWAGPLIRIGFYSGESDIYYDQGDLYRTDYDFVQLGIGAVTGVNIKVGRRLILSPSAGIRSISAAGTGTEINLYTHSEYEEDITGDSTNVFANFALLF